jgi:alpha-galactosidase
MLSGNLSGVANPVRPADQSPPSMSPSHLWHLAALFLPGLLLCGVVGVSASETADIRTPPPPATPRINGPTVFGVRPGSPFLYRIPVTGDRPMTYAVDGLPAGLSLDANSGIITGRLTQPGEHAIVLRAQNAKGHAEKHFRIVCGEQIALTPPMGWNSWNCWAQAVDQDKVLRSARTLVSSGLVNHGWAYVNIDDTWQGERGGPHHAIQGNERFPDMKRLCEEIHALGLKAGVYSSPWITTFAGFRGGSSDDSDGKWERLQNYEPNKRLGRHSFAANDAAQLGEWGFDYLKYDWAPNDVEHTKEMAVALRATGRDFVLSLSCSTPIESIGELSRWAQAWRTTGDIWDTWETPGPWQNSVSAIGFNQDGWTTFGGPGHWNDPDMLVLGYVGWGPQLHATRLTPAEQYTHISLWCLFSAPLLIGCDLERLDAFTLNLLTNDEVLALDQDPLGRSARRVATLGAIDVFRKELEDGSSALGFFNRGDVPHALTAKLDRIGLGGRWLVRDLWRQQDAGVFENDLPVTVGPHDVMLYKLTAATPAGTVSR